MTFELPDMTLTAAGSKRRYNLSQLDRPTLLIVQNDRNIELATEVNRAVRATYPSVADLWVLSIADMQYVPTLIKSQVKTVLAEVYEEAVATLPPGLDGREYIVILPDWRGKVARALNIRPNSRYPSVAVVDDNNSVIGKYSGKRVTEAALQLLAELDI